MRLAEAHKQNQQVLSIKALVKRGMNAVIDPNRFGSGIAFDSQMVVEGPTETTKKGMLMGALQ